MNTVGATSKEVDDVLRMLWRDGNDYDGIDCSRLVKNLFRDYDGIRLPSIFKAYDQSILVTSYSKELSLPGERIGFAAVNPHAQPLKDLVEGMVFCNRTLGFVNAPALMQRVIEHLQGISVDIAVYQRRRDLLCEKLASFGYRFVKPEGAFYLFPESPIDDVAFVQELQKKHILTVPGRGFGMPGFS